MQVYSIIIMRMPNKDLLQAPYTTTRQLPHGTLADHNEHKLQDKTSNNEVFLCSYTEGKGRTYLRYTAQVVWNVLRMEDCRLPNIVLYDDLK